MRLIRSGNEHDHQEFDRREQQQKEEDEAAFSGSKKSDNHFGGGSMFSMLPKVDREDELHSRAEYYHQYARENFMQEADCLMPLGGKNSVGQLEEQDVQRLMFLFKKGDKDRKWLLQDMMFPDPYQKTFPNEKSKEWEKKAMHYIRERKNMHRLTAGATIYDEEEDDDDGSLADESDDDNDDGEEYPSWFLEKHPNLARKK